MKTLLIVALLGLSSPDIDPNTLPFGTDPNAYSAPLGYWALGEPNTTVVFQTTTRNKGGWDNTLEVVMADGTPTDAYVQSAQPKPVKDPDAGGFKKDWTWGWTPPGEGVFYLELRAIANGKPDWKQDKATVVIYCYGEDYPEIWLPDPPIISEARIRDAQRWWQSAYANAMKKKAFEVTGGLVPWRAPTKPTILR